MTSRQLANEPDGEECQSGYSGDDCSIRVESCLAVRTDLVHNCYHGSSCIDASNDAGLLDRYCECYKTKLLTAGLMCEFRSRDGRKLFVTSPFG